MAVVVQLVKERQSNKKVQLSQIETERLLAHFVQVRTYYYHQQEEAEEEQAGRQAGQVRQAG